MKNVKYLLAIFVLPLFILTSCEDDDGDQPDVSPGLEIAGISDGDEFQPNEDMAFTITVTPNLNTTSEIDMVEVSATFEGTDYPGISFTEAGINEEVAYVKSFDFDAPSSPGTGVITIEITDAQSNLRTEKINFTVSGEAVMESYTLEIIATGASESFYSASKGEVYSYSQIQSDASLQGMIDFAYYYGNTDKASIANVETVPDAWFTNAGLAVPLWGGNTLFTAGKVTNDFDAISNSEDLNNVVNILLFEELKVTELAAGDVYGFKTEENWTGLFKVNSVTGTFGPNDYISIDVKVMPPQTE